ncbi:hypothetical protein ACQ4LE_005680 [Meloidogyne hapla]|uniref:F-box domain-containing protein n=1 Tax=Meloidogyne hapla TaxID=6305 RepID=A0A1I8BJX0_MELHA
MYFPPEVKIDIFKCLNFDQLFAFQQTNRLYRDFVNKYEDEFARKTFFSLDVVPLYSTEDLKDALKLNEEVKPEFGFVDFPLSAQLEKKWQVAIAEKTPMFIYSETIKWMEEMLVTFGIVITTKKANDNPKYLLLNLPYIPKSIEEMRIWRCWVERIFRCAFVKIEFLNILLNPKMMDLFFDETKFPLGCNTIERMDLFLARKFIGRLKQMQL